MERHIVKLLKNIAAEHKLSSDFDILISGENNDEKYCTIRKVKIIDKHQRCLNLVIKHATYDAKIRDWYATAKRFCNEDVIFRNVLPKLQKYGCKLRFPTYFGSSVKNTEEILIVSDVSIEGFSYKPISEGFDEPHMRLVIEGLASLYSSCVEWRKSDDKEFFEFGLQLYECDIVDPEIEDVKMLKRAVYRCCMHAASLFTHKFYGEVLAQKFNKARLNHFSKLLEYVNAKNSKPYTVLSYGSAHCGGIMFKYDTSGKPIEVSFGDWSCSRLGSPMLDITQCLHSSGNLNVLKNAPQYLEYYNEVTSPKIFQYPKMLELFGKYGLFQGISFIIMCSTSKEVTFENFCTGILTSNNFKPQKMPNFKERVAAVVNAAFLCKII